MKKILILLSIFLLVTVISILACFLVYQNYFKKYEYNGRFYRVGEGFTHMDGCNSCSFTKKGEMICTLMACDSDEILDGGIEDGKVRLDFTYKNDVYKYTGAVQKPTPCDGVTTDAIVRESSPEQVTLQIVIEPSDQICAQVITEEEISGEIKVSKQARIEVTLNGETVRGEGVNNN
ncbi:hypothetical protein JW796_04575 [Candidatus Dojkabacteria bacterium]|nr:hypothetical protein [Candidatus Dojkabacteria bacterium]